MKTRLVMALLLLGNSTSAFTAELSFKKVWSSIVSSSDTVAAARQDVEAAKLQESAAKKYFYPRVYLSAKTYQTDVPSDSFIGLVEQKSIQQSDFNPTSLNNPTTSNYTTASVGVALPLYEGGNGHATAAAQGKIAKSKALNYDQTLFTLYGQVASSYGILVVFEKRLAQVSEMGADVQKTIDRYQLGNRGNPVGYSGLLGLKSLSNRLRGITNKFHNLIQNQYLTLKSLGLLEPIWTTEKIEPLDFVNRYLNINTKNGETSSQSIAVKSLDAQVDASFDLAKTEKSKMLPRLGAFAESTLFSGDRDTATGNRVGLFLQWELYQPGSYDRYRAAVSNANSLHLNALQQSKGDANEKIILRNSVTSLRENISLLNESYLLIKEQTKVSQSLFKSGALNALQIAEILNRQADVIVQLSELESELIIANSKIIQKGEHDVSTLLGSGEVANEK